MNDTQETNSPASVPVNDPINVGVPKVDIDWNRAIAWWKPITMTLPISWRLSHLLLCAFGVVLTSMYTSRIQRLFDVGIPKADIPGVLHSGGPQPEAIQMIAFESLSRQVEQEAATAIAMSDLPSSGLSKLFANFGQSSHSFLGEWGSFLEPLHVWLTVPTLQGAAYSIASLLGLVVIWGLIGGCIVRRSVVEIGTGLVPSWNDTFRWVRKRAQSIFWALTMPSLGVLMLCMLPFLVGLTAHIPVVGAWVAGILMLPVSLVMFAIGWTAAITLLGFPMAVTAIVTEKKADAFDGISRSGAYLFQRPVLLLIFAAAFECISRLGGGMFSFIIRTGSELVSRAFALGAQGSTENWDWNFVVILPIVLAAFGLSYFWTAQAAMYLLLRKSVDSAELDSIDLGDAKPA